MKTIVLTFLIAVGALTAQAGGYHYYNHSHYWGHSRARGCGPSVSFYYGGYPAWWGWGAYSYPVYPGPVYSGYYGSYPVYSYDYGYARPNYAVSGTLLGALAGGLIGNSIHHQGWEGAGIGAAAGLLLGSVAEHNARAYERAYDPPAVSYAPPRDINSTRTVNDAPAVPSAPRIPDSPRMASSTAPVHDTMSGANSLFGR
jgi:YMGG-like Gly-zipper